MSAAKEARVCGLFVFVLACGEGAGLQNYTVADGTSSHVLSIRIARSVTQHSTQKCERQSGRQI